LEFLILQIFHFTLIGVILFRYAKEDIFQKFIQDVIPNSQLVSLPIKWHMELINAKRNLNLDFDDAYQYSTAKYYELTVATMDKDFKKIKDVDILFL